MRVACRWPGGMTLALPRTSGNHVTVFVNGPPGQPTVFPTITMNAPSRNVAHRAQKAVADTVKALADSVSDEYPEHLYGTTEIPGDFWNEWYRENQTFDVVTKDMVFALD